MQVLRATNPTQLGYSYDELKHMDDISVSVMPEKKGMVFKHVEYLVESRVSPIVASGGECCDGVSATGTEVISEEKIQRL